MKIIDTETWNRKEHFEFFSKMASPFFGITAEVDCTETYRNAKESNQSFFATYLHKSMLAVNTVEELKLRIADNQVVLYDTVDAGATIARADGTFAFIFVKFSADFQTFAKELRREIAEVQNSTGLRLNDDDAKTGLIRHSTLPWLSFSAILHPTNFNRNDAVPKITFGKIVDREGRKFLPVSVEAHHGLADGYHIAKYFAAFQRQLDIN